MGKHLSISPKEAADRLAIRELVETYAHCADRRDAKGQMALFTTDTHFVVYMNAKEPKPSQELHSREALAPVFADLNRYDATTHFVGQSTIFTLDGDRATGEAYCLAHHIMADTGKRRLMIASPFGNSSRPTLIVPIVAMRKARWPCSPQTLTLRFTWTPKTRRPRKS